MVGDGDRRQCYLCEHWNCYRMHCEVLDRTTVGTWFCADFRDHFVPTRDEMITAEKVMLWLRSVCGLCDTPGNCIDETEKMLIDVLKRGIIENTCRRK